MIRKFPNLGDEEEFNEAPSAEDYVGIIMDTLLMGKNVGILFHMCVHASGCHPCGFHACVFAAHPQLLL
jgi:hypothetical protein